MLAYSGYRVFWASQKTRISTIKLHTSRTRDQRGNWSRIQQELS